MTEEKENIDFEVLFERYYPGLLFYATRFLNEAEAKDVVQDTFFDLWTRRDRLNLGAGIQAYLYRQVYTRSINHLNHKQVCSKYSGAIQELYKHKLAFYESTDSNEIIRAIENKELRGQLLEAINELPDKCKEVFRLSYLQGLKNKEIAEVLDISPRTVEAHMYKALKTLRLALKRFFLCIGLFFLFFYLK